MGGGALIVNEGALSLPLYLPTSSVLVNLDHPIHTVKTCKRDPKPDNLGIERGFYLILMNLLVRN